MISTNFVKSPLASTYRGESWCIVHHDDVRIILPPADAAIVDGTDRCAVQHLAGAK